MQCDRRSMRRFCCLASRSIQRFMEDQAVRFSRLRMCYGGGCQLVQVALLAEDLNKTIRNVVPKVQHISCDWV